MTAENRSPKDGQTPKSVDVAIVGGAMAGASLALGLMKLAQECALQGKPSFTVALIEAHNTDQAHPGFDARSIAIAHGSVFELTRLGIWPKLAHLGTAINNIHVSDRGHFGMTELNASQFHLPALGQVVELERVGQVLTQLINESAIQYYCPHKLASVDAQTDGHLLTLDSGEQIWTKLLVAADGVNSVVRQAFNQPIEQVDFAQTAVIANVVTDTPHDHWAWERFTNTGPLALLPMSSLNGQHRLSLVWAQDADNAGMMKQADDETFLSSLQEAFGNRAGRFMSVGQRHTYPLTLSYMPRPIYHRCVFIGNAAQTLHPIAGQGFNLGLRDVMSLLDAIGDARHDDRDIGASAVTHQYLASRDQDRHSTINNIEFLVRGFSNDYWPLVAGRSLGLRLLSWVPPLKTPVAYKAMGFR